MSFSIVLKKLRKSKGLTQEELAKILCLSPSAIGLYEQGSRMPRNDTIIKIAEYFGVTIDFLLGFDDINEQTTPETTYDDFTYALYNETSELTPSEKNALLDMVKSFKKALGK